MENEIYVVGEYISGLKKRPDLVNQPCVLVYKENGLTLSVLVNEQAESFDFSYDSIDNITVNNRLIATENTTLDRNAPSTYDNLLAFSLTGIKGYSVTKTAELSDIAFNPIGKIDYSKRIELVVEYHTDTENRRLLLVVHNDPTEFVEYFKNM